MKEEPKKIHSFQHRDEYKNEKPDFSEPAPAAVLSATLASLKLNWPFRRRGAPGVCNYFFEDGLYPRPAVKRKATTLPASRFEELFRELDSGFSSTTERQEAETWMEDIFRGIGGLLSCRVEKAGVKGTSTKSDQSYLNTAANRQSEG